MQSMASEQQKPCDDDADVDLISDLPEPLISHILSLLPTQFAVRTCVLARAWKLHWTRVTSFDFDERLWLETDLPMLETDLLMLEKKKSFLNFVTKVLTDHSGDPIDKFRLRWSYNREGVCFLRKWLGAALTQNVRVLDLDISAEGFQSPVVLRLPEAIYTCGTVEVLKLRGKLMATFACDVCLPRLTVLKLKGVQIGSHECVCKLVLGCPLLQSLSIGEESIFSLMMGTGTLSSPTLKHLHIYANKNGQSVTSSRMEREIDAPALEWLSVKGNSSGKVSIQCPISADELNVDLCCACPPEPDAHNRPSLPRAFGSCATFLKLYEATMTLLGKATKNRLSLAFEGITKLVVRLNHPQWSSLVDLVDRCISLEVLHISREEEVLKGTSWKDPGRIPECLSRLKRVTFQTFYGMRGEMKMLNLILDHGLVLQRVELHSVARDPEEFDRRSAFLEEMSKLPRASPTCEITSEVSMI